MLVEQKECSQYFRSEIGRRGLEQIVSHQTDGYITGRKQVEQFKKLENKKIPEDIDYNLGKEFMLEALAEIKRVSPRFRIYSIENIWHACRYISAFGLS